MSEATRTNTPEARALAAIRDEPNPIDNSPAPQEVIDEIKRQWDEELLAFGRAIREALAARGK